MDPQLNRNDDGEQLQFSDMVSLAENEIQEFSMETLAETNRPATSQTSVSGELLWVGDDEITRFFFFVCFFFLSFKVFGNLK